MKAELVPDNGDPPIPVIRDVTIVGRRDYCDVQIDDPSLSKRHCVLVKTDGLLLIRDLASTNGTKVKGQRIRWAALLPDDRISLGGYKLRVYLGPDDMPGPSELPRGRERSAAAARRPQALPLDAVTPAAEAERVSAPVPVSVPIGFGAPTPSSIPAVAPGEFWVENDSDDSGWRDQLRVDLEDRDAIIELD